MAELDPRVGAVPEDGVNGPPPGGASAAGPQLLSLPAGTHQLCRCGRSRHGWFCDGAHLGTGLVSYELRLAQPATVLLCGCGRTGQAPLCDGSHARAMRPPWWRRWWGWIRR
ncbi:MAG: CDGSH iron-sulfur domain-containing protein [Synechococcaceae cyanobacterium]|nr:CDGSH iron-sulfur domain-containing protein [Synechococcaceae cyanobacterium]